MPISFLQTYKTKVTIPSQKIKVCATLLIHVVFTTAHAHVLYMNLDEYNMDSTRAVVD